MNLPKQLNDEIWDYCRANSITNVDEFITKMVKRGFTIEKFGTEPQVNQQAKPVAAEPTPAPSEPVTEPQPHKKHVEIPQSKDIYGEN
jgi:hypothetical protein